MRTVLQAIQNWEELAAKAEFQAGRLSLLCRVSPRQLQRFFKLRFNTSPSDWLRQRRCLLAKNLLAQGWSNKAVASDLRYADPSHFCHEFKKTFRTSPRLFAAGLISDPSVQYDFQPVASKTHDSKAPVAAADRPVQPVPAVKVTEEQSVRETPRGSLFLKPG